MPLYLIHPVHPLQILRLMGDDDKGFVGKVVYKKLLQEFIIFFINISSSLIQYQYRRTFDKSE